MLYQIERRKYRRQGLGLLLAVFVGLECFIAGIQVFQKGTLAIEASTRVLLVFDALSLLNVIILPIVLASLVSISVQLESRHQMWKILQATGVSFQTVFRYKFAYVFQRYLLTQLVAWGLLIGLLVAMGFGTAIPWLRLMENLISSLVVSVAVMEGHFFLSLRYSNPLISLAVALVGSLVSMILLFLPIPLYWISPYSWYGLLMSAVPEKVGDSFAYTIRDFSWVPLVLALVFSMLCHVINERQKVRE